MKLIKAQVKNYRSIVDSGLVDIENGKTIFVGPNEAGKSAFLQALQKINPPKNTKEFEALRDYPRSKYSEITSKRVDPAEVRVVDAYFSLDAEDKDLVSSEFHDAIYILSKNIDNSAYYRFENGPSYVTYGSIKKSLLKHGLHLKKQLEKEEAELTEDPTEQLQEITVSWKDDDRIKDEKATNLLSFLEKYYVYVEDSDEHELRHKELTSVCKIQKLREETNEILRERVPVFVYFSNYFRVRPTIHLRHLAQRTENNVLDDDEYDYGNNCLLKLLGFTADELAKVAEAQEPDFKKKDELEKYKAAIDERQYKLNAASVDLTKKIRGVWFPDKNRAEADRLNIRADRQYLKVVVEDNLGVEIELSQRSEGFQWLVSFFVVFFAEAMDKHANAILLLDEPGLSLHGLKQRDFRKTLSRLSEKNQTIYTTHSPFLVGPDELDLVRVVEMMDREVGTKIFPSIKATDPAGLLPLQEALGYDLAQSLFTQKRNLILEGLTDYWYIDATAQLLQSAGKAEINDRIAMIPAHAASKVVYFATILHSQNLKVAVLFDSDNAGNQAAKHETLVGTLGNKNILRTLDFYNGPVEMPEVEDLLRETLISVAKEFLGWDVEKEAKENSKKPIVDIFQSHISEFSKYKLAKAYMKWTRENDSDALKPEEIKNFKNLIVKVNKLLK